MGRRSRSDEEGADFLPARQTHDHVSHCRSRGRLQIDELPHAAIGQPPDDPIAHMEVREGKGLRPGGFGLLSVRSSVDELLYNEQRNEVVFVKYLDGA
jgi:hypothetical protein